MQIFGVNGRRLFDVHRPEGGIDGGGLVFDTFEWEIQDGETHEEEGNWGRKGERELHCRLLCTRVSHSWTNPLWSGSSHSFVFVPFFPQCHFRF